MKVPRLTTLCLIASLAAAALLLNSLGSDGGSAEADLRFIPPDTSPRQEHRLAPADEKAPVTAAEAQAAIQRAQAALQGAQGVSPAATAGSGDPNGHLQEAASEIANATRRLQAGDTEGALDKAEEALKELAKAERLRAGR